MKKLKRILCAAVLMGGLAAIPLVQAQDMDQEAQEHGSMDHQGHEGRGKKMKEIFSQLNLTEEQKTQLEANKKAHRGQMKGSMGQMKAYRAALKDEFMKPDLDMNKISSIQGQVKALQAQMTDERLNSILEVRKILTPDQFSKFLTLMHERRDNHDRPGEK